MKTIRTKSGSTYWIDGHKIRRSATRPSNHFAPVDQWASFEDHMILDGVLLIWWKDGMTTQTSEIVSVEYEDNETARAQSLLHDTGVS